MKSRENELPPGADLETALEHRAKHPDHLEDLEPDEVKILDTHHRFSALLSQYGRQVDLRRISLEDELQAFLAGRTDATVKAYSYALERLFTWCQVMKIHPLEVSPREADLYQRFLVDLRQGQPPKGLSEASIRANLAAVSSFYSQLARRNGWLRNPFLGAPRTPRNVLKAPPPLEIPTREEVERLLEAIDPRDGAFVSLLAYAGLRVDGARGIEIRGSSFVTVSKNKGVSGTLPRQVLTFLILAGAFAPRPFVTRSTEWWRSRVIHIVDQAHRLHLVNAAYSPHDFRHYFAVTEYQQNKDIYRLQKRLGHSSIATTTEYLKALPGPMTR